LGGEEKAAKRVLLFTFFISCGLFQTALCSVTEKPNNSSREKKYRYIRKSNPLLSIITDFSIFFCRAV